MKVEKLTVAHMPFKDQFKKEQQKKKAVEPSKENKDSNFIGWA